MTEPAFLTLDELLALHQDQIERYGGAGGIRDLRLLSSALGAVCATFDGAFLHQDVLEMAAAYLFYLSKNHPFVDGNKLTALAACLAFLWMNDLELDATQDAVTGLVLGVASGQINKSEVAVFLKKHTRSPEP